MLWIAGVLCNEKIFFVSSNLSSALQALSHVLACLLA